MNLKADERTANFLARGGLRPEDVLRAGLSTGHLGTARLAWILAGYPAPCDGCDFLVAHCRCHDEEKGTE